MAVVTQSRTYRLLAALDRAWGQTWWSAVCVLFVVVTWRSGPMARWFVGISAVIAVLAVLLVLTGHGVRRVRLAAGAWTAVSGAVLTMFLSEMAQGVKDDQNVTGAVAIALFLAAVAGWIADERIARAADRERTAQRAMEQQRHDEVLKAISALPTQARTQPFRLLAPWALVVLLLGRQRHRGRS